MFTHAEFQALRVTWRDLIHSRRTALASTLGQLVLLAVIVLLITSHEFVVYFERYDIEYLRKGFKGFVLLVIPVAFLALVILDLIADMKILKMMRNNRIMSSPSEEKMSWDENAFRRIRLTVDDFRMVPNQVLARRLVPLVVLAVVLVSGWFVFTALASSDRGIEAAGMFLSLLWLPFLLVLSRVNLLIVDMKLIKLERAQRGASEET